MIETREVIAVFVEDTGAIKCGYCGKTLCFIEKKGKKNGNKVTIAIKCNRCSSKNEYKF